MKKNKNIKTTIKKKLETNELNICLVYLLNTSFIFCLELKCLFIVAVVVVAVVFFSFNQLEDKFNEHATNDSVHFKFIFLILLLLLPFF